MAPKGKRSNAKSATALATTAAAPATQATVPGNGPEAAPTPVDTTLNAMRGLVTGLLPTLNAKGAGGGYTDDTGEGAEAALRPFTLALAPGNKEEQERLLKAGLEQVTQAREQERRTVALDKLRAALNGYSLPASLLPLARQAHEAGAVLSVTFTPAVEAKPEAVILSIWGGGAPRAQGIPGAPRAGGGRGRAAGPVVTKGAAAYLGHHQAEGAAGRAMPNGKVYSAGTRHNAGQALKAYLLEPGRHAALGSLLSYAPDGTLMFDGQQVTSELLRTHPRLQD